MVMGAMIRNNMQYYYTLLYSISPDSCRVPALRAERCSDGSGGGGSTAEIFILRWRSNKILTLK